MAVPVLPRVCAHSPNICTCRRPSPSFVIAGEFFSGIGLIVGLFSRIAALVIVLTMVGAIVTVHFGFGLFLNWFGSQKGHGIEYHLLAIVLALVIAVKGAGAFSLDGLIHEHVSGLQPSVAGKMTLTLNTGK